MFIHRISKLRRSEINLVIGFKIDDEIDKTAFTKSGINHTERYVIRIQRPYREDDSV